MILKHKYKSDMKKWAAGEHTTSFTVVGVSILVEDYTCLQFTEKGTLIRITTVESETHRFVPNTGETRK